MKILSINILNGCRINNQNACPKKSLSLPVRGGPPRRIRPLAEGRGGEKTEASPLFDWYQEDCTPSELFPKIIKAHSGVNPTPVPSPSGREKDLFGLSPLGMKKDLLGFHPWVKGGEVWGAFVFIAFFFAHQCFAFQTEFLGQPEADSKRLSALEKVEAGLATKRNVPLPLYYLAEGEFDKAYENMTPGVEGAYPWLKDYLEGMKNVSKDLVLYESKNFDLYLPPDQTFLKDYAVPALESIIVHLEKVFDHKPAKKIRVEIYPTKESFSAASTLSMEILKRSGAIGICKFHRLMILSPRGLPLGYRWMDALAHEFMHLMINELSYSQAELWLHEGTARYFDTSYRSNPPSYLTPNQKTNLMEAQEEERLIGFKRMSPSLVYLDSQDEVSLAFAQVSHAIGTLVEREGRKKYAKFLKGMRKESFRDGFKKHYGLTPDEFESRWKEWLSAETWEKTKGAMSDDIHFEALDEDSVIGANVKGKVRLGDRMRQKKLYKAALLQYEKALEEEPDNAIILLKAARTHLSLDQQDQAILRLRRAVKSNPNYGTPHIALAKMVSPKEALPLLLTAVAINPFDPEIHELLSAAYKDLKNPKKSLREEEIFNHLKN